MNHTMPTAALLAALLAAGCGALPAPEADESRVRIGNLEVLDVPEIPAELTARLARYQHTRSAILRGWVGDELLITTRFGDTNQLHAIAEPMSARRQLTFYDEPVANAFPAPHDAAGGFVFARDTGGSEFYQLFFYDLDDGGTRLLTDGESRYDEVVWANAADRFAYTTTERDGTHWDIHLQTLEGERRVLLETERGAWSTADFAPADDRLLVLQYLSINESRLYELDLATLSLTPLLDSGIRAAVGEARYSGDGRGVYFTSDLGAEFMRLHYLDLATRKLEVLTSGVPWDVERMELSRDGRLLAMSINEHGISRLRVWRLPERKPLALPALPEGVVGPLAFSADGRRLAFSIEQPTAPGDVFTVDLEERKLVRWTESETGGLDAERFVAPELVEYPTFDAVDGEPRQIPAFVYRPAGPGPHPVLISIHGGPEGQYRPRFSPTFQYFAAELGVAVIAPNVRGSSGYGKSYLKLDNGKLREDSVRDIGALLDWLGTQPDLDPDRVAVMGGSYGGYMVLASLVHYSPRLAAGVESVGISNFVSFLENTQDYRRDLRRAEYGDERDPEMRAHLEAISPLNRIDAIERPLLISQGANDPRVPASESEQMVDALRARGVPVWYVLAEDEGHGFKKKVNRDYLTAATVLFLERFLLAP